MSALGGTRKDLSGDRGNPRSGLWQRENASGWGPAQIALHESDPRGRGRLCNRNHPGAGAQVRRSTPKRSPPFGEGSGLEQIEIGQGLKIEGRILGQFRRHDLGQELAHNVALGLSSRKANELKPMFRVFWIRRILSALLSKLATKTEISSSLSLKPRRRGGRLRDMGRAKSTTTPSAAAPSHRRRLRNRQTPQLRHPLPRPAVEGRP